MMEVMTELFRRISRDELLMLLYGFEGPQNGWTWNQLEGVHDASCSDDERFAQVCRNQIILNSCSPRAPPASRQHLLGSQILQHIDHLHPHTAWIELLPARLGFDAHTDLAALALGESLDYYFGARTDDSLLKSALRCYDRAVSHLRQSINSSGQDGFEDATLITVSLLAVCEVIMNKHSTIRRQNVFVHWSGLRSVFIAKYLPCQVSDIGRAILYNLWDCNFGVACGTGTASPFESGGWRNLDPVAFHGMSSDAFVLRKIAHIFFIRVPGLIKYVRSLRQESALTDPDIQKISGIAKSLYDYQDDEAESAVLHRIRVNETKDPSARKVVPYSYSCFDVEDFNAAVLYWSMRQCVINLLLKIHELVPAAAVFSDEAAVEEIKAEKQRYATNTMMSWEFAEALGPFETIWVAKGLLQNWLDLRGTTMFKNVSTASVRAWVLQKSNHPFNEWLSEEATESDLDVAADLLVGGPMVGFISHAESTTP